jgi:hypothetical protein
MPSSSARRGGTPLIAAPGRLAGHEPPPVARGGGAARATALGLSAGHRHSPAAYNGGAARATALSLSTGHGPLPTACGGGPIAIAGLRWTWVFGFNFQLVIQNTLVSITTSLGHTLWCNLVHTVKIITGIFVFYEMEFSKLIN